MAYFSAHLTYVDSPQGNDFLAVATALWETAAAFYVTQSAAETGTVPVSPPVFNSSCGVFTFRLYNLRNAYCRLYGIFQYR